MRNYKGDFAVWKQYMRRTLPWLLVSVTLSGWAQTGWPNYGNDAGGTRYSAAQQIDRSNVARLQPVWTYRTGALEQKTVLIK
jgi:glucose dehydrogenase